MVVTAPALQAPQATKKLQFYPLTAGELKRMYDEKQITTKVYILLIVKIRCAAGWKMTIDPKEFCAKWGIKKSSFYNSISQLKTEGELNWEVKGRMVVWWGTDIAREPDTEEHPEPGLGKQPDNYENSVQPIGLQSNQLDYSPTDWNLVQPTGQESAETLTTTPSYNATDIEQILNTHTTDTALTPVPHPDVCESLEKEEEQQVENLPGDQPQETRGDQLEETRGGKPKDFETVVKNQKIPTTPPQNVPEDRSSPPPLNKTSKTKSVTSWCPGTQEEYLAFLNYKGLEMLAAGLRIVNKVNYRSVAANWANKNPDQAAADFENWVAAGKPKSPEDLVKKANLPKFETWTEDQHLVIYRDYKTLDREEFLAKRSWHADWIDWIRQQQQKN